MRPSPVLAKALEKQQKREILQKNFQAPRVAVVEKKQLPSPKVEPQPRKLARSLGRFLKPRPGSAALASSAAWETMLADTPGLVGSGEACSEGVGKISSSKEFDAKHLQDEPPSESAPRHQADAEPQAEPAPVQAAPAALASPLPMQLVPPPSKDEAASSCGSSAHASAGSAKASADIAEETMAALRRQAIEEGLPYHRWPSLMKKQKLPKERCSSGPSTPASSPMLTAPASLAGSGGRSGSALALTPDGHWQSDSWSQPQSEPSPYHFIAPAGDKWAVPLARLCDAGEQGRPGDVHSLALQGGLSPAPRPAFGRNGYSAQPPPLRRARSAGPASSGAVSEALATDIASLAARPPLVTRALARAASSPRAAAALAALGKKAAKSLYFVNDGGDGGASLVAWREKMRTLLEAEASSTSLRGNLDIRTLHHHFESWSLLFGGGRILAASPRSHVSGEALNETLLPDRAEVGAAADLMTAEGAEGR